MTMPIVVMLITFVVVSPLVVWILWQCATVIYGTGGSGATTRRTLRTTDERTEACQMAASHAGWTPVKSVVIDW